MSWFSNAWNAVTGAASSVGGWLNNPANANTINLIGGTIAGVGGYFAQKEAAKDQMKLFREQMNLERQLKSEYSAVPDVDTTYNGLTVSENPSLAGGGILTEMKKRKDDKAKRVVM